MRKEVGGKEAPSIMTKIFNFIFRKCKNGSSHYIHAFRHPNLVIQGGRVIRYPAFDIRILPQSNSILLIIKPPWLI